MKTPASFSGDVLRVARKVGDLSRVPTAKLGPAWAAEALEELATCVEELKVAEEELRVQNEELGDLTQDLEYERHRYREIFMGAPHAYVVSDLAGTMVLANRMAGELLGLPAPQLASKTLPIFVSMTDRERFHRWLRELHQGASDGTLCGDCGGQQSFELRTFTRDRTFRAQIVAAPIVERDGRVQNVRWVIADLTDRERASAAQKLQEEAQRKDKFLAVLGHELRNPLAAITLAADILAGERGGDARRIEWASDVVKRHAEQLRRLVDDLLDLSRVTQGKVTLHLNAVDLRDVVAAAAETVQTVLHAKRHTLSAARGDEPFLVRGDAVRLTQIVSNLLDNAAKYTPDGGAISLDLRRDGDRALVSVTDNGIGIPSHMLERIFEVFEQVTGTNELTDRGLGLGLALVHQLVGLHGGAARASSPGAGKGSTFTIELPLMEASDAIDAGERGPAEQAAPGAPRVLIIDDNQDAAELLALALRARGFVVDVAVDGTSGLSTASANKVGVALVDLGLPDMDGYEVCRRLRRSLEGALIVAITGYGDQQSRSDADDAGFDAFLLKPVTPDAVTSIVRELTIPTSAG